MLILVAIMLAAFLLRMHYLAKHTEYTADSYYFLILARSIRDTFTYTVRGVAHTKYLPGYPIIDLAGRLPDGRARALGEPAGGPRGDVHGPGTYGIGRELFNKWAGLAAGSSSPFSQRSSSGPSFR